MLPGAGIGATTGPLAGLLALVAGLPLDVAGVHLLALGLPMALFGGGYTLLCAYGIARVGSFAPAGLYWAIGFPISRIVQEGSVSAYVTGSPSLPEALWAFALYNALLSTGLAFGYIWLHERLVPLWLMRIREDDPVAARLSEAYTAYAALVFEQRERRKARRAAARQARRKG